MRTFRRRRFLIEPRLQLLAVGIFVGVAASYILLQAVFLGDLVHQASSHLPVGSEEIEAEVLASLRQNLVLTALLLIPMSMAVGFLVTFRIVGPIYRFKQYLRQLADGRVSGPCTVRSHDELQDFCVLLNRVTAPLWRRATNEETPRRRFGDPPTAQLDDLPSLLRQNPREHA